MAPKKRNVIDGWIQGYLKDEAPRSKSLMISAFGDSIAPYADGIWLGDFIELMAPLGLNERLVRTSAFRLIEEGWLRARREGRRSYYALTAAGVRQFEAAYSHIYQPPQDSWDECWTQVLLPRNEDNPAQRIELKRELEWEGFTAIAPSVLIHPSVAPSRVQSMIDRHSLDEHVVVLRSKVFSETDASTASRVLSAYWDLREVEKRYQAFLARFASLLTLLDSETLTSGQAFQVQTLLIHSFRRANLHDPRLPAPMLPADWTGLQAYRLCRDLYCRTYERTREHLLSWPGLEVSDTRGGRLGMAVDQRFGGLTTNGLPRGS